MLSAVIQVIYFSLILLELNAIAFTKVRFESIYSMYPKKLLLGDKNYSKFVGITFPLKNYVPSHCIICQLLSKQKKDWSFIIWALCHDGKNGVQWNFTLFMLSVCFYFSQCVRNKAASAKNLFPLNCLKVVFILPHVLTWKCRLSS